MIPSVVLPTASDIDLLTANSINCPCTRAHMCVCVPDGWMNFFSKIGEAESNGVAGVASMKVLSSTPLEKMTESPWFTTDAGAS